MEQYISKSALVAEIERRLDDLYDYLPDAGEVENGNITLSEACNTGKYTALESFEKFIENLEVKEVGISIPNIDDILKEEGLDPDSKDAKVFKESYYMGLEKFKALKGE